jgi:hypothetical protein
MHAGYSNIPERAADAASDAASDDASMVLKGSAEASPAAAAGLYTSLTVRYGAPSGCASMPAGITYSCTNPLFADDV